MKFHGITMAGNFNTDNINALNTDGIQLLNNDGTVVFEAGSTTTGATYIKAYTGTSINEFSTDGTLAGDSDDAIPTEKAVKTYVDTEVGKYDTFIELSDTPASYTTDDALYVASNSLGQVLETTVLLTEGADTFTITQGSTSLTIDGYPTTITGHSQANNIELYENLTIGDGYNVTITAQDADGFIRLDEQSLEVEGEGTATRLFKLKNEEDAARTVTFYEDFTIGDGYAGTLTFKGSLKNLDIYEDFTIGNGYAGTLTYAATGKTIEIHEDLTIGTGFGVTISSKDAAGSITLDEQSFEVEGEGTATRLFKLKSGIDADVTLTVEADSLVNQDLTTDATGVSFGTITSGEWQATDVAIAHGGTGASTAANARSNLGFADIVSATESGAYYIAAFDEFECSDETNVQGVLDDLDNILSTKSIWKTEVISVPTSAEVGIRYVCYTSDAAFTVKLPAAPNIGDTIGFVDQAGTFDTNNMTIVYNDEKIMGLAEDMICDLEYCGFLLVYSNTALGWRVT